MTDHMPDDLSAAGRDLRAYTDELRPKHPVVRNVADEWVLLRHADVAAAALDHERFSSAVSRYLQVPNGLDGDEHARYREVIERYLTHDALVPFVPVFKRVAAQLVVDLPRGVVLDAVSDIGAVFAVRAQCEWLGWPAELEPRLLTWMQENHAATRSGDRAWTSDVAEQFDEIIRSVIQPRRAAQVDAPDDVTTRLCRETVDGRLLTETELVSILRNWTGGDLGSIALCVGVIVAQVAEQPGLAARLRTASDAEVDAIIDEMLRIDDPFVSNRRVTTCPVRIGGVEIPSGARVKLNWTSANRDETVFDNNRFDPQRNAAANLVYGIGKHVCPGRLLATWELRIALQALLASVNTIEPAPDQSPEREVAPVGGYHRVPVVLT
ncbi:cytochrome P450 [Denitromonas ohlonensis]|uniref:Cytochrome P450 n=2 Tax=Denitromonas TaxID=139331 RepID=A0A557RL51_9RHOO|nr:cytochrome P450 [Denitromonas ohlonensis]TVO65904.1 cytochrome P450 [Denitromonas ohlonensis]TVO79497.1 cytochrome P450 [Denitromonas ohlonensis]